MGERAWGECRDGENGGQWGRQCGGAEERMEGGPGRGQAGGGAEGAEGTGPHDGEEAGEVELDNGAGRARGAGRERAPIGGELFWQRPRSPGRQHTQGWRLLAQTQRTHLAVLLHLQQRREGTVETAII